MVTSNSTLKQTTPDPILKRIVEHPRFLPGLMMLLGGGLGTILAYLIVQGVWHLALVVLFIAPAIIVFASYPFSAVLAWLLIIPYFLNEPTAAGRAIYWLIHRAMIPGTIGIVLLSDWLSIAPRKTGRLGRAELSMLFFMILALANIALLSNNISDNMIKIYDRIFIPFCMYWLIRLIAPESKDIKQLLWVALVTILVQASVSLISWFAPQVLPPKWVPNAVGERTVGTLRNPAVYTSTLLWCAVLLFQYAIHIRRKGLRGMLLVFFSLALYFIFMSFSRGSWAGAVLVLVCLTFIYPKVMLTLLLILVLLGVVLGNSLLAEQVAWGYERLTGEEGQRSAESRVTGNVASVGMIKTKPFFGWGYGNYDRAKRPFMRRFGNVAVHNDTSHNTYLTIMAELGVINFILYVFPVLWWLSLTLKVWKRLPRRQFEGRYFLVVLWLVILHMFVVTNFMDMVRYLPFGVTIWWMTLGLIGNRISAKLEPCDLSPPSWVKSSTKNIEVNL